MADGLTADSIITAVRDFAGAASSHEDAADARLLRILNRAQELELTALLASTKGNHRKATLDYTVTSATTYAIPTRAIAAGIAQVEAADSQGNVWMMYEFPDHQRSRGWPRNGHFYVQGNNLIFYAVPPAGTLRITYNKRLSQLVLTTSAAVISSISGGTIGIVAAPTTGDLFGTGATSYDFIKSNAHFDILAMDKSATRAGTTLTFTASDVPSDLAVGDYVALAKQTPVCQAPLELHGVLAQMCVVKWLESKADPRLQDARQTLRELTTEALKLLEPRSESDGEDILFNPNAPGWTSRRWAWRRSSG